jgi:hypothetical protein
MDERCTILWLVIPTLYPSSPAFSRKPSPAKDAKAPAVSTDTQLVRPASPSSTARPTL